MEMIDESPHDDKSGLVFRRDVQVVAAEDMRGARRQKSSTLYTREDFEGSGAMLIDETFFLD